LTEVDSCSNIGTRVFTPKNDLGVVYSKKSPQGERVPFVRRIGANFSLFEKEGT
jgi:hypothetical protein